MSTVNRVIVAILALVILAGAVITLLVTAGSTEPGDYGWLEAALQDAADAEGGSAAVITIVCIFISLSMVALLLIELVPLRKSIPMLISSSDEGITTIDRESVRILAERTATAVYNVRDSRCSVGESSEGLVIACRAMLTMGCNIPEISSELQSKVKEAVVGHTGLPVAQVNVTAEYETVHAKTFALR